MTDRIKNLTTKELCGSWSKLKTVSYEYLTPGGEWEQQKRELYDRGNGAAIILFNRDQNTVILTRQLRIATHVNGNDGGMMIEACAGLLDKDSPETAIIRETEEETGYKITDLEKLFTAYTSPGSVTEILHFFAAEYSGDQKVHEGGGVKHEQENIEVLEIGFKKAMQMIEDGTIRDAKTIMLLQYLALHKKLG